MWAHWSVRRPTDSRWRTRASVKAVFGVPDTAMANVKLGSPQSVTTEALPGSFVGTHHVDFGGGRSEEPSVFGRGADRQSGAIELKAGMIASIALGGGRPNAKVMVVPLTAVIRSPDQ